MATNWNAVLANINNSADVLAVLRKVLASLDYKMDQTTVDALLAQFEKVASDGQVTIEEALETVELMQQAIDAKTSEFNDAIEAAAAAGAGANGWTAQLVRYKDTTQDEVNDEILGENGASSINLTLTEVANSVKKSLHDTVYDLVIDVTWFGAVGNWNKETQTGVDSTAAVANAIAHLSLLGTRRTGGKRGLKFPKGSYRLDRLPLPEVLGFGLDILGDGPKTTNLYFNQNYAGAAIQCEIEFVQFRDMSIFGSLDEKWPLTRTPGYVGRLPSKGPDIDVTFVNCDIVYWNTFAQIYGRGCVFDSCMLGLTMRGMEIVVTSDQTHGDDTDLMQSKFATMRHYVYRNCRFDNTSRAYVVSGTGEMLDHINNLLFIGNDITSMDKLIEAPTATFVNSVIGANTALGSFATTAIEANAFHLTTINFNNFCKVVNYKQKPTSNATSTEYFIKNSAPCSNLNISNNTIRGIRTAFYANTSTSESSSISLSNNILSEFGSWKNGNVAISFYSANANCKGLIIANNNFHSTNINGSYYLYNINSQQFAYDVATQNNYAPWSFSDRRFSYTPSVFVGNIETTGTYSIANCTYVVNGDYVEGDYFLGGTIPEKSGSISIDLPLPARPENSTYSAGYSGRGFIINPFGFVSSGYTFENAFINAQTQKLELRKGKDLSPVAISAADVPGNYSLTIHFKYRFK